MRLTAKELARQEIEKRNQLERDILAIIKRDFRICGQGERGWVKRGEFQNHIWAALGFNGYASAVFRAFVNRLLPNLGFPTSKSRGKRNITGLRLLNDSKDWSSEKMKRGNAVKGKKGFQKKEAPQP